MGSSYKTQTILAISCFHSLKTKRNTLGFRVKADRRQTN
jgi:hypothetical protein